MSIAYTSSRISSITDGAGRVTSFSYNADYTLLQSITEPSTNKVINFEYTGNELTKITDPDGHYSTFTYDADGKMTSAVNYDGYKITYDYYTIKPYRVKTVQEVGTDSTDGQSLNIAYGENTTLFTDADNRTVKYEFNDSGNTMNVQDCTGGAQYYDYSVYDGDINNISQGNKLTSSSKFQKTDVNYLKKIIIWRHQLIGHQIIGQVQ